MSYEAFLKRCMKLLFTYISATSQNFNHCERVFVSAKRKPFFSDATSTVSFFCNRSQKPVLRSCSAPNKINRSREVRAVNESFDQNFHIAAANLAPDFRNCQFLDCFDNTLIQSNNVSGSKRSLIVFRLFTHFMTVLKLPVLPVVKVIFQRAAHDTFT